MSFTSLGVPARLADVLAGRGIDTPTPIQAATLRYILVGIALMLLVIFRPQGILGNKKELTFVK